MKKIIIAAVVVLVIIVAVASGGGEDEPTETAMATAAPKATDAPTKIPPTETPIPPTATPVPMPGIGETLTEEGCSLQAVGLEDPAKPGILYTPEEGKRLVVVEFVIGSVDRETLSVNPLYTELIDAEGFTYQVDLASCDDQIATTEIGPGKKVRGKVGFTIPMDSVPASIRYQVDMFPSKWLEVGVR